LKEKDIMKFGKQKIKIREVVFNDVGLSPVFQNARKTKNKIYDNLNMKGGAEPHPSFTKKEEVLQ
jgi:hypothetical protein